MILWIKIQVIVNYIHLIFSIETIQRCQHCQLCLFVITGKLECSHLNSAINRKHNAICSKEYYVVYEMIINDVKVPVVLIPIWSMSTGA